MQKRHRAGHRIFILVALFTINISTLLLGMTLFLTKSPQSKSDYYVAVANGYIDQVNRNDLNFEAVNYLLTESQKMLNLALVETPYNANLWKSFSEMMLQLDNGLESRKAEEVAVFLGADVTDQRTDISFLVPKPLILSESKSYQFLERKD